MSSRLPSLITLVPVTAAWLLLATPHSAFAQELTPEQLEQIRVQLNTLDTSLQEISFQKNSNLTDIYLQAAASPKSALNFYLDCLQEVNFERLGKRETEFREWKDEFESYLESDELAGLLQIQLRYLAITTEAARAETLADVFPLLTQYVDGLTSMSEIPNPGRPRREFRSNRDRDRDRDRGREQPSEENGMATLEPARTVDATVFALRYDLAEELQKKATDWELDFLNVGGIYEKTILPYLRSEKPDQVLIAWQKRMDQEARLAMVYGDAAEEVFRRLTLPELQWGVLRDEYDLGAKAQAVAKMLAHIDAHKSSHPKAADWLAQARDIIFGEETPEEKPAVPSS